MEEWKDIIGYETYSISSYGRVRRDCKILSPITTPAGYKRIPLSKDGISKGYFVHRLVAIAFIPNPENKLTVNHKNHIRDDNNLTNLEWATSQEQALHSRHALGKSGLRHIRITPFNRYALKITRNHSTIIDKTYSTVDEAISERDKILSSLVA